ncbi:MAG TPA: hypothetical protein VMT53_20195 [Terriglobales bacterium]|nr:hypothetical protein [Terriglobales bacterium]
MKDGAEDALGQQVLHQHALDGFRRKIWIDGLLAQRIELFEAAHESRVSFPLFFDDLEDRAGQFGNALGEFVDRFFPFLDERGAVVEKLVDDLDEIVRSGYVFVRNSCSGLVVARSGAWKMVLSFG